MGKSNRNATVLVVDDQERNIQVVGATLTGAGYDVMAAGGGDQALERVAARVPDLVLLDVIMPGMDGFEVCRRLREEFPTEDLPIIFLSAADETEIIVRALEEGGVDYVTKPFNKSELLARVDTHIELKRARDQVRELLEQRESFTEMMAHDLKNPLGGASFSMQMLAEKEDEIGEKLHKLAVTANDGIGRALKLIEDYLEDVRSSKTDILIKPTRIDLADCVSQAVDRHLAMALRKSIVLNWTCPEGEMPAKGDPVAIGRVLDNLLSNALKFSDPESHVWVIADAEQCEVRIRDQGPGLAEEDFENLFKSYSRLSARPTGGEASTGLGLSIAMRFVKAMDGKLEFNRDYTGGAEFVVSLPICED